MILTVYIRGKVKENIKIIDGTDKILFSTNIGDHYSVIGDPVTGEIEVEKHSLELGSTIKIIPQNKDVIRIK